MSRPADTLKRNSDNRQSILQHEIEGIALGENGLLTILASDRARTLEMLSMLNIINPKLMDNPSQARVAVLDKDKEEVKEHDANLVDLMDAFKQGSFSEEEGEYKTIYDVFYYLIHQVYYNKQYLKSGKVTTAAARMTGEMNKSGMPEGVPEYFNSFTSDEEPALDMDGIMSEIKDALERMVEEQRTLMIKNLAEHSAAKRKRGGEVAEKDISEAVENIEDYLAKRDFENVKARLLIAIISDNAEMFDEWMMAVSENPGEVSDFDFTATSCTGDNLLHVAVRNNSWQMAGRLIGIGKIPVDAPDHEGLTPLQKSVNYNNRESTCALLMAGANVDVKDADGFTPFGRALIDGNIEALNGFSDKYLSANVALNDPAALLKLINQKHGKASLRFEDIASRYDEEGRSFLLEFKRSVEEAVAEKEALEGGPARAGAGGAAGAAAPSAHPAIAEKSGFFRSLFGIGRKGGR